MPFPEITGAKTKLINKLKELKKSAIVEIGKIQTLSSNEVEPVDFTAIIKKIDKNFEEIIEKLADNKQINGTRHKR